MTNEEIQRVMDFIVKQQASFADGMEQMREESRQRQALAEERFRELERAAVNLYNVTTELTGKMVELAEAQKRLAEAQAHTDQRVDALIDFLLKRRDEKGEE